ncbi:fungal-specific transcription factor domain-containing protein [Rhexocercosporidium sp. MPI-PUGE-AT-0058]|nr:fungal-specific transcription factor domain-containing protein [Rhexocercosporidium sp. MPI-PUGE-AT-0058]
MQNTEPTSTSENPDDDRPVKRKRVAIACEPCRDRKVKCDGGKPTCKVCEKRAEPKVQCVYNVVPQTAKQISEQEEYIASLQKQIQDLQQAVRDAASQNVNSTVPASDEVHTVGFGGEMSWVNHNHQQQNNSTIVTAGSPLGIVRSPGAQRNSKPCPVSAMGALVVDRDTNQSTSGMYGQSSVHSLLQEVSHSRLAAQGSSVMVSAQYALPPRQVADELLGLYFNNTHIFYPYTHSVSFQRRYESLWTSSGYPGPHLGELGDVGLGGEFCPPNAFFCALNAMFALGCEFSKTSEREKASAVFRDRMQELLHEEFLDYASIAHVQALLLSGHYLLTTEHPTRCYNVVGLACRIAVGLGLHSYSHLVRFSVIEKEMRRRVWYACLQLEMTVCMTLGRLPLLQVTDDVPFPMAIDDGYLNLGESVCEQPQGVISQNLFMVENLKLAKVLAMILGYIYGANLRGSLGQRSRSIESLEDGMSALLRLDGILEQFEATLPEALNWKSNLNWAPSPLTTILQRQKNVLRARFLHLRILLYRPSFSLYCSSLRPVQHRSDLRTVPADENTTARGDGTLTSSIRKRCATSCVQAACELTRAIELATMNDMTGAWWFGLFYIITCSGIVILAECAQLSGNYFDQGELNATWESCIVTLQELGKYHSRVDVYVQQLRSLRERALSEYLSACNSNMPSRMASRRASAEPVVDNQEDESSDHYGEGGNIGLARTSAELGHATLLDSWDYNWDSSGFIFDDDMLFHLPTYIFSSTNQ